MAASPGSALAANCRQHCAHRLQPLRSRSSFDGCRRTVSNLRDQFVGLQLGPAVLPDAFSGSSQVRCCIASTRPSAKSTDERESPWDNYVDRIINSGDELESEHVLIGATLSGDYPLLVHKQIYDQHFHVLGDSGARKTSLGMSPLATQLIARGDASVVIIDLKGDNAFFQTCRIEAARTRHLRFRWISNEVGKTTFGFNPFLQKHNQQLTLEQLTQQILRG